MENINFKKQTIVQFLSLITLYNYVKNTVSCNQNVIMNDALNKVFLT